MKLFLVHKDIAQSRICCRIWSPNSERNVGWKLGSSLQYCFLVTLHSPHLATGGVSLPFWQTRLLIVKRYNLRIMLSRVQFLNLTSRYICNKGSSVDSFIDIGFLNPWSSQYRVTWATVIEDFLRRWQQRTFQCLDFSPLHPAHLLLILRFVFTYD